MNSLIIANNHILSFIDYPSLNKSALTYYVYGCGFHCPGCQNKELQKRPENSDINTLKFDKPCDFVDYLVDCDAKENKSNKLVVLQGGDPIFKENRDFIRETIKISADKFTGLKFCIYTGFQIEFLQEFFNPNTFEFDKLSSQVAMYEMDKVMSSLAFIKCGEYDVKYTNHELPGKRDGKMYFATTNQKLYKYIPGQLRYELVSKDGIADLALDE